MKPTSTKPRTAVCMLSFLAGFLVLAGCSLWSDVSGVFVSNPSPGEESIESFVGSLKLRNGDPENMYRMAVHYQKTGRHDWAIEEFRNILAVEPSFARAYNGIGVSLDHYKKHDLAQKAYLKALEIDPELDYAWNNLGYSVLLEGRPEAAAAYFEKALTLRGDNTRYRNNLTLAMRQMRDRGREPAEALADLTLPHSKPRIKVWKKISPHDDVVLRTQTAEGHGEEPIMNQTPAPLLSFDPVGDHTLPVNQTLPDSAQRINTRRVIVQPFKAMAEDVTFTVTPVIPIRYSQQRSILPPAIITLGEVHQDLQEDAMPIPKVSAMLVNPKDLEQKIDDDGPYIEIANGNGMAGMAASVKNFLRKRGFSAIRASNADHFDHERTKLFYHEGYLQEAWAVAKAIPGQQNFEKAPHHDSESVHIKVVLGKDLRPYQRQFKDS